MGRVESDTNKERETEGDASALSCQVAGRELTGHGTGSFELSSSPFKTAIAGEEAGHVAECSVGSHITGHWTAERGKGTRI